MRNGLRVCTEMCYDLISSKSINIDHGAFDCFELRTKTIHLTLNTSYGEQPENIFTAAHEGGHALQYNLTRAFLFIITLRNVVFGFCVCLASFNHLYGVAFSIMVGYYFLLYFFNLFLEFDASRRALHYLNSIGQDVGSARTFYKEAFKTYLFKLPNLH